MLSPQERLKLPKWIKKTGDFRGYIANFFASSLALSWFILMKQCLMVDPTNPPIHSGVLITN